MTRYTLDPELISMQRFYSLTCVKKMIPSRRLLHEGIEEHFRALESAGIENLKNLFAKLGSKEKIAKVAREKNIPEAYLSLLKREAGSYLARPFPLTDFPSIPHEYTEVLKTKGIRSTRDFFESLQTPSQRKQITKQTGIPEARLHEIYSLCDLSRITGVEGFYARIIYHAGIRTVGDFAETDAKSHARLYLETLEKLSYPVKNLAEDDLEYCISYAKLLNELNSK